MPVTARRQRGCPEPQAFAVGRPRHTRCQGRAAGPPRTPVLNARTLTFPSERVFMPRTGVHPSLSGYVCEQTCYLLRVTHCTWAAQHLTWEGPAHLQEGPHPHPHLDGWSLCTADLAATRQGGSSCSSSSPGGWGEGRTGTTKPALPLGHRVDSGDTGEQRQLCPSAVPSSHARRAGAASLRPHTAAPFEANAEAMRPRPCPGAGPGLQRPERSSSAMLSIHFRARRWSPGLGRLVQATGGLSRPLELSHHRLPTSEGAAASPKTEGEPQGGLRHRVPRTVLGPGTEGTPRASALPPGGGRPARSLLERGELVEGVPEERRLPLGLRQGEHLLLRDAGGHGDVALVQGVQRLVRRGHGAPAVA